VNGYLLDTNVALLATFNSASLVADVRKALENGPNYLSVGAYWEVVLKSMKGALKVGDPRTWWLETLEQLAATPLALMPEHIDGVCVLPAIHKDPFDRILIAQATAEDLTFLTTDAEIAQYASEQFRVLS
jgi:PIN domain nuclease of toxin-antitoxin system